MNDEPESYIIDHKTAQSVEHRHGILISFADGGEEWSYCNDPKLKAEYEKQPPESAGGDAPRQ